MTTGTIYGVGLGPGDPDLISRKADRLIRAARHVAYFRKAGRPGQARCIVKGMLNAEAQEYRMEYPVTTEISFRDPTYNQKLAAFYADCTAHLRGLAEGGEDVVVLCEGDPFFYGSFMHLYERLKDRVAVEVVPGITGMSGAWTATGIPVSWGDDVLVVLTGTLSEQELTRRMADADALVVMKLGRNLDKVRRALVATGRLETAWLVEHATMPNQTARRLSEAPGSPAPYFSMIVVHGQGRRP